MVIFIIRHTCCFSKQKRLKTLYLSIFCAFVKTNNQLFYIHVLCDLDKPIYDCVSLIEQTFWEELTSNISSSSPAN